MNIGRKPGTVRDYVKQISVDDAGRRSFQCMMENCTFMRKTKEFTTSKWADHIALDCKFAPQDVRQRVAETHKTKRVINEYNEQSASTRNSKKRQSAHSFGTGNQDDTSRASKQMKIDEYADKCNSERAEAIIAAITKFVVGCAIPFNVVNSPYFTEMIASLNTAAVRFMPKSKAFTETHLPSLYKDTSERISNIWGCSSENRLLRTMGFDGFTNEVSESVVNITETSNGKSAFVDCIDPGANREDSKFFAGLIEKRFKKVSTETKLPVEEVFCGIVADNVACNRGAFRILEQKYPKLFFIGCMAHAFDLMIEDVCKVSEVKEVVSISHDVCKFVKGNRTVQSLFKRKIGTHGTQLVLFPTTRFAYCHLMLQRFLKNKTNLESMVDDENWLTATQSIKKSKVEEFETHLLTLQWSKASCVNDLLSKLSEVIHHVERTNSKASWIYQLGSALTYFFMEWSGKASTKRNLKDETISSIKNAIIGRWIGEGSRQVGICSDHLYMAWILDPYTTPKIGNLVGNWEEKCTNVLSKFYSSPTDIELCLTELKRLVLREGAWGELIERKQAIIQPSEETNFKSIVEKIIWQQTRMLSTKEDWETTGRLQFKGLHTIGKRLAVLAIQSADVERVCKSHKLIHSKIRNRLRTKVVSMLLFSYVNLRLLRKCSEPIDDFLSASLEGICSDGDTRDDEDAVYDNELEVIEL